MIRALCILALVAAPAQEVEDLIQRLGDRDWKVRDAAEQKLLSMGPKVRPHLEKALEHDDAEIRWRAERLLGKLKWSVEGDLADSIGDLFEHYDDLALDERLFVVEEVANRVGVEGIPILQRMGAEDPEPQVRERALRKAHSLCGENGHDITEDLLEALDGEEGFWAHRWAAEIRHDRGESEAALESCRKAIELNRHDPLLNSLFVRLLMDAGAWEEATALLEEWRSGDDKNPLYPVLLGRAYHEAGRAEEAREQFDRAVEMEPEDLAAYVTLIRACIDAEEYDVALRFVENSQANYPEEPSILRLRAEIHETRGEYDLAFRHYRSLYQSSTVDTEPYLTLREKIRSVLAERGEGDLATDALLDEIHHRRIRIGLWEHLGDIYGTLGLGDFAVEELRRALIFKRSDPSLLRRLSEADLEIGETALSQQTATRGLEIETIGDSLRATLEALSRGEVEREDRAGMPPLLWEWKVRQGDEWERTADLNRGTGAIPPVAVGSIVIVAVEGSDTIVGIDSGSGTHLWRFDPPEPPSGPPSRKVTLDLAWVATDGEAGYALYNLFHSIPGKPLRTARRAGILGIALEPREGTEQRRFEADAPVTGTPSDAVQGRIILSEARGGVGRAVRLLHLPSGQILWERTFKRLSTLPPTLSESHAWIALHGGALLGLDAETGEEAWRGEAGSALTAAPIFTDGGVVVGTSRGRIVRLDTKTTEEVWSREIPTVPSRLALLPGGRLLVGQKEGSISCWNVEDGSPLWRADPGKAAERVFIGTEDHLYALNGSRDSFWDEEAEVIALDPQDGRLLWRKAAALGGNILVAPDRLILADGDLRRSFRVTGLSTAPGPPGPDIQATVLQIQALSLSEARKMETAIALLEKAVSIAPRPDLYLDLARGHFRDGEFDRALEALDAGEDLEGADSKAFETLRSEIEGKAEQKAERRRELEEAARRAAEEQQDQEQQEDREDDEDPIPPPED